MRIFCSNLPKFVALKKVATLYRCQLRIRDSEFILKATADAPGFNNDEFGISKSLIQRIRIVKRKERAEKIDFQNEVQMQ